MNIEQLKSQIKDKIIQIEKLDVAKLYPTGENVSLWQNMSSSEIEKFVKNVTVFLQKLKNNLSLLDTVGFNYVQSIDNHLTELINQFASLENLTEEQITSHHHNPLNQLNEINNILRSSALYTELRLKPQLKEKIESLEKVEPLLKKLTEGSENYEKAIDSLARWLKKDQEANQHIISGQANAFKELADSHKLKIKGKNINYWLVLVFIFSAIVACITIWIIKGIDGTPSAGQALIRIASLLIPGYLTVFSVNQYLYHKKMYEIYKFKHASLKTMNNLMGTKDDKLQEKILTKGLGVLFSEPTSESGGGKYDKQLVGELLSMLRSQIEK